MRDGWNVFWMSLGVGLLVVVFAALVHAGDVGIQQHQVWSGSPATGQYFSSDGAHMQTFDSGMGASNFFFTDREGHHSQGTVFYAPRYLAPMPSYNAPLPMPSIGGTTPPYNYNPADPYRGDQPWLR